MAHTDKDLNLASQIAYYDFQKDQLDGNATIEALLQQDMQSSDTKIKENATTLYELIQSTNADAKNWVIKDVKDDNENTGFYGCVIETKTEDAIIAFRGSEGVGDPAKMDQFYKDWYEADLGLLNTKETKQQALAEKYMTEINKKYSYDSYNLTGHSLGGNLATHALLTAPESMLNNIERCQSNDGPGFSDEYLTFYQKAIKERATLIDHYQWSVVGNILNPIPGENFQTVKVKDEVYDDTFGKHALSSVVFDNNGNVQEGKLDPLASIVHTISNSIDNTTYLPGTIVILEYLKTPPIVTLFNMSRDIAMDLVKNAFESFSNACKNWFTNTFLGGNRASFLINTKALSEEITNLKTYYAQLQNLKEQVNAQRIHLRFLCLSSLIIQRQLNRLERDLNTEANKVLRLKMAGERILQTYTRTEDTLTEHAVC